MHEQHPWKEYVPDKSTVLFVGTFPPIRKRWSYDFFYPNKANFFWRILAAVAKTELHSFTGEEAVNERKALLNFLQAGITDMGLEIYRKTESSLDENIVITRYTDILSILLKNPSIKKIIFTSSSGQVSAARCFELYLATQNIAFTFPKTPKPVHSEFVFQNRTIALSIVYSPSGRSANKVGLSRMAAMYADEFL